MNRKRTRAIDEEGGDDRQAKARNSSAILDVISTPNPSVFSPLRSPESVIENSAFPYFSSENTLSVTSVKSSSKYAQIIAGSSTDSPVPQILERLDQPPPSPPPPFLSSSVATATGSSFSPRESPTKAQRASLNFTLAVLLAIAYSSFIFCRSFFTVTQEAMKIDEGLRLTDALATDIIFSYGIAFGVSKMFVGVFVSAISDPKQTLLLFMIMSAILVALAASPFTKSVKMLKILAVLNAFPQAGAYPAVAKLVCSSYQKYHHSTVFSYISIGSRFGQVLVTIVLGEVLRRYGDWRIAVAIAPAAVILASIAVLLFVKNIEDAPNGDEAPKKSNTPMTQQAQEILLSARFWTLNLSSAILLISKGFDSYAVSWAKEICVTQFKTACKGQACMCVGYGVSVTSALGLGIIASLFAGAFISEKLSRTSRAIFVVVLTGANAIVCFLLYQFTVSSQLNATLAATESDNDQIATLAVIGSLLFALGFSSGYPFYVPQALFAVEFGSDKVATVVGLGECVQSLVAALFLKTALG